ncbi:MAG: hypothetical protein OXI54_07150 [Chloroflexota bacterium]|nr:hypothetical protein [Chloroflexota bacterium]MYC39312.1 hypothetical protein [Chloroflexota bacterium]
MSKKRSLTGEQEDGRIQGLRLLARIIARHYLEHPDLYPAPSGDSGGGGQGRAAETVRAGGNAAQKEASQ